MSLYNVATTALNALGQSATDRWEAFQQNNATLFADYGKAAAYVQMPGNAAVALAAEITSNPIVQGVVGVLTATTEFIPATNAGFADLIVGGAIKASQLAHAFMSDGITGGYDKFAEDMSLIEADVAKIGKFSAMLQSDRFYAETSVAEQARILTTVGLTIGALALGSAGPVLDLGRGVSLLGEMDSMPLMMNSQGALAMATAAVSDSAIAGTGLAKGALGTGLITATGTKVESGPVLSSPANTEKTIAREHLPEGQVRETVITTETRTLTLKDLSQEEHMAALKDPSSRDILSSLNKERYDKGLVASIPDYEPFFRSNNR